jgi:type I restriction-modification system DNA methylase subunit
MAKKEANFDLYIHKLLNEANIVATAQGSEVTEINNALKTATKKRTGKAAGYPEYTAVVCNFVIIIEDKPDRSMLELRNDSGDISLEPKAVENYALNGALHYATHIIENTGFKCIFAFGNAGDEKHHIMKPLFVDENGYKELPEIETFENFSADNIDEYYRRMVLQEEDADDLTLSEILKKAKELHESLRNYGGLGEDEKPLVVSAILLALREQKYGFKLDSLIGDTLETDGSKLFKQLETCFTRVKVKPETKRERVLNQFTLIKDRPKLNTKIATLGDKTPLRFFAEFINTHIFKAVIANAREDFLGRFYGEFVSYSGGDGQSLGVVLTPRHITELFCDLVELKSDDVIFDPCCGTGGFLVSGMHRLLALSFTENDKATVKAKQIHGIEDREDMFAIATTNMILRGDGQSNLLCGDFFSYDSSRIQTETEATVGLMNPPYSQGSKDHPTLYEICFIRHLLDSILEGGRVAVIVPVSTMIGKSKEEKEIKKEILKHHTLEGVISCNKNTFYGVGVVPCIAVFTTGKKHPKDKLVRFINFEDDGFEVRMHVGLVETERAKDRRSYLLDCWRGKRDDVPSKFMITTTIEDTDEWIHSFYYYNDEIPTEQDFINSIADYLTFEFNMITHGRGYLFGGGI